MKVNQRYNARNRSIMVTNFQVYVICPEPDQSNLQIVKVLSTRYHLRNPQIMPRFICIFRHYMYRLSLEVVGLNNVTTNFTHR